MEIEIYLDNLPDELILICFESINSTINRNDDKAIPFETLVKGLISLSKRYKKLYDSYFNSIVKSNLNFRSVNLKDDYVKFLSHPVYEGYLAGYNIKFIIEKICKKIKKEYNMDFINSNLYHVYSYWQSYVINGNVKDIRTLEIILYLNGKY